MFVSIPRQCSSRYFFLLSSVWQVWESCVLSWCCGFFHWMWKCIREKCSGIQIPISYVFRDSGAHQVSGKTCHIIDNIISLVYLGSGWYNYTVMHCITMFWSMIGPHVWWSHKTIMGLKIFYHLALWIGDNVTAQCLICL